MEKKKCNKCKVLKSLTEYSKSKKTKDGLQYTCKKCKYKIDRAYFLKNHDSYLDYQRKYYENNREKLIKQSMESNIRRRKKNPLERYKEKCRSKVRYRLNKILDGIDFDYCDFIGCDSKTFKNHLNQFMNDDIRWNNRDEWQLDHIKPLFTAKTKEDLNKLSHYTNIQILLPNQNKEKYQKNKQKF